MNTYREEIFNIVDKMCSQYAISGRDYGRGFRKKWVMAFERAFAMNTSYLPANPDAVLEVQHSFDDFTFTFHIDQVKMYDWFQREMDRGSKQIFEPKKIKRRMDGTLTYDESTCVYDPKLPEPALTDKMKNIIACALPGLPAPQLRVVYGNKWVNSRFNPFRIASLHLYLLNTDYVPVFLGSPVEVCLYLFLMDCCIIKLNYKHVLDKDLQPLLHIFRPSPMLQIKGIIQ